MVVNNFITKLTKECDKYPNFIDHDAIQPLRFERDMVATHQILGPLFKDEVLEIIIKMLKAHCLSSLTQGVMIGRNMNQPNHKELGP
ncbi:hypothetical protein TB2_013039 [Malus domestica]